MWKVREISRVVETSDSNLWDPKYRTVMVAGDPWFRSSKSPLGAYKYCVYIRLPLMQERDSALSHVGRHTRL